MISQQVLDFVQGYFWDHFRGHLQPCFWFCSVLAFQYSKCHALDFLKCSGFCREKLAEQWFDMISYGFNRFHKELTLMFVHVLSFSMVLTCWNWMVLMLQSFLVGGLEHQFYFPIYWVSNHPNWLSYSSEGWPNHQPVFGLICWNLFSNFFGWPLPSLLHQIISCGLRWELPGPVLATSVSEPQQGGHNGKPWEMLGLCWVNGKKMLVWHMQNLFFDLLLCVFLVLILRNY